MRRAAMPPRLIRKATRFVYRNTFQHMIPHHRALGLRVEHIGDGTAHACVPYKEELVGDPTTGVLHGGVITTLLDSVGGMAALGKIGRPIGLATLDLRIDYLRPARAGKTVHAKVECYKLTRHVAFTRGVAYDENEDDPVASASATYMLDTRVQPASGSGPKASSERPR